MHRRAQAHTIRGWSPERGAIRNFHNLQANTSQDGYCTCDRRSRIVQRDRLENPRVFTAELTQPGPCTKTEHCCDRSTDEHDLAKQPTRSRASGRLRVHNPAGRSHYELPSCSSRLLLRVALDPAEGGDAVVENIPEDDTWPRLALRQVVVILGRNLAHLR